MVMAVQCPQAKCRKFMLVEEEDRGKIVTCLICKSPIRVGGDETKASTLSPKIRPIGKYAE